MLAGGVAPGLVVNLAPPNCLLGAPAFDAPPVKLHGADAIRAADVILPHLDRAGAARTHVADAVKSLEGAATAEAFFRQTALKARRRYDAQLARAGEPGSLCRLPTVLRLALEMASHEEQERRALEGDLAELEGLWREAEEIAAIADDMFVGDGVRGALTRLWRRVDAWAAATRRLRPESRGVAPLRESLPDLPAGSEHGAGHHARREQRDGAEPQRL